MKKANFQKIIDEGCSDLKIRGLLARLELGATTWSGVAGELSSSDLERGFYICSLTKTFTAIAILKLCEQGKLSLEKTVSDFLSMEGSIGAASVNQLLNHSSRILDYVSLEGYLTDVYACPKKPWPHDSILEKIKTAEILDESNPGAYYSNTGYLLLRLILESVTQKTFSELIHELVIEPLGLTSTYVATELDTEGLLIPAFDKDFKSQGGDVRGQYHPDWCATGVVVSTVREVCHLYRSLFEGKILTERSISDMICGKKTPFWLGPNGALYNGSLSNGLGIKVCRDFPLGPFYGHGGDCPGYSVWAGYIDLGNGEGITSCIVGNQTTDYPPVSVWMKMIKEIECQQISDHNSAN